MTQPLALVLYEKLLPGTQLVNRLQDLNYRVQAVTDAHALLACARQEKPIVIVADTASTHADVAVVIREIRSHPDTRHIPVIAVTPDASPDTQRAALDQVGVMVVGETAVLQHLAQVLEQALHIE